jgi:hypothetical protein
MIKILIEQHGVGWYGNSSMRFRSAELEQSREYGQNPIKEKFGEVLLTKLSMKLQATMLAASCTETLSETSEIVYTNRNLHLKT